MSKKTTTPVKAEKVSTPQVLPASEASNSLTVYGENPLQLVMPGNLPEKDYLQFGRAIGAAMTFAGWRIGDWVNYGENTYSYKDYAKQAEATGLDEGYLRTVASVAKRIPPELRAGHSLENFRLMLQRKNEKESIPKLIKRLGNKTQKQLRDMAKSQSPKANEEDITAEALWSYLEDAVEAMMAFKHDRLATFATIEASTPVLQRFQTATKLFLEVYAKNGFKVKDTSSEPAAADSDEQPY